MSDKYKIAETDNFRKKMELPEFGKLKEKIYTYIYPQLRVNPFFGPNIKKLTGNYENVYRYRTGDIRLFYVIESDKILVIMLDFALRKDAYKKK